VLTASSSLQPAINALAANREAIARETGRKRMRTLQMGKKLFNLTDD
jgi:hypothetical protein